MPASSSRDAPFYLRTPPRDVAVRTWALRDDPWRAIPVLVLAAAAAVGAGIVTQSLVTGLIAAAAIAISMWRTWLPVRYEFDPRGIIEIAFRRRRRFAWLEFGGYEFTPRGLLLFPRGEPTWWNAAGAAFVLWSGKRAEIVEIVEYYLGGRLLLEEGSHPSVRTSQITATLPPGARTEDHNA